jgi:DNA (cytosine-5)-methyltransferase 1
LDKLIVSLFSGAGGFDLGFAQAGGYSTILANEILDAPVKTLTKNSVGNLIKLPFKGKYSTGEKTIPAVTHGDVKNLDFSAIDSPVHLLIGGPPCQDFSQIRGPEAKRLGIKTVRGKLYVEFLRGLQTLNPGVFVFENVPGILTSGDGEDIKTIREDLQKNYDFIFNEVVDCTKIGVAQTRKRLIIIGVHKELSCKVAQCNDYLSNVLHGKDLLFSKFPMTPIEIFNGRILTDLRLDGKYRGIVRPYLRILEHQLDDAQRKWLSDSWDTLPTESLIQDYQIINGATKASKKEFSKAMQEHEDLLKELGYYYKEASNMPIPERNSVLDRMVNTPPGANFEFVVSTKWAVKAKTSNIYKRISPLKPSPTIIAKGGGGTWGYHFDISRGKLNHMERTRLQTFPDDYVFAGNDQDIRSQIGEAVPPLLAKRIANALVSLDIW